MRVLGVPATLAALLAANLCQAQWLINELSFGHSGRLSTNENPGRIPGFALSGQPRQPELLSNKVILTPIAPGNQRGAIWAETPLTRSTWVADVDFRANGPERGGGNMNIWLARRGSHEVGSNSIYTVGKFDGLGLVIDAHGGSAGMIRGFLNDGTVDYMHHQSVDKLAFGHCQYSYRNLGRPSQIKLRQTINSFKVEIDGKLCFETDKVSLPPGYYFGITAATPDSPDSFEVFKMVVMSDSTVSGNGDNSNKRDNSYATQQKQPPRDEQKQKHDDFSSGDIMPDEPADQFTTSREQFQDLHNRLQSAMHQISAVHHSVTQHHQQDETRHSEMKKVLDALRGQMAHTQQTDDLLNRLKDLEKEVRAMRNDINKKFTAHDESFQGYLSHHHATLSHAVASSMPSHGKLIFIFVGTQAVLVAAYVVYKRRRANSPKKYL
ncbi:L-like Lectin [Tolypocladium paradoxum]|uniref:L-like Lectin n=1 Tax=Tolypocladium paradoxum TaxID=94208 RepID=A0A2S4LBA0_9HYPO|nr:L-like Lectin [Tolypocladium paradoxum]